MLGAIPGSFSSKAGQGYAPCGDTDRSLGAKGTGLPALAHPPPEPVSLTRKIFNGDFVDRGSFSVEVILTLFGFKLLYPDHFHLLRGEEGSTVSPGLCLRL